MYKKQILVAALILSSGVGCSNPTAPMAMGDPESVAEVVAPATTRAPEAPLPAPSAPTPEAPVPKAPQPQLILIGANDCDINDPTGSIRCYNRGDVGQTVTISLNSKSCDQTLGSWTTTIGGKSNGYFTLPRPQCGKVWQFDGFHGASEGSCQNPDFALGEIDGGKCAEPPSVVPPPVCQTGWTEWEIVNSTHPHPVCKTITKIRYLKDCNGRILDQQTETKTVCQ